MFTFHIPFNYLADLAPGDIISIRRGDDGTWQLVTSKHNSEAAVGVLDDALVPLGFIVHLPLPSALVDR